MSTFFCFNVSPLVGWNSPKKPFVFFWFASVDPYWGAVGFIHGTTSAGNVTSKLGGFGDKTGRKGPELQRISGLLGIWGGVGLLVEYWDG